MGFLSILTCDAMNSHPVLRLHGTKLSGHTHRVELLLRMLALAYEFVPAPADVRSTPEYKEKLNPLGQIPVLEVDDLVLCDSNAILVYLCKRFAPGSSWLPEDAAGASAVQRWLSIAAGEVMYGPASARAAAQWNVPCDIGRAKAVAARLLAFMETHLAGGGFLAGAHATIADLACYAYVAHAPEGGIGLDDYPSVRAWLARVEQLPRFAPMPPSPLPAAS